jgi:hypothetical protein
MDLSGLFPRLTLQSAYQHLLPELREHHHVEPTLPLLRAARPYLIAAIAGSLNQPLVLVTGRVETAGALV